jgi:hypothetical protein
MLIECKSLEGEVPFEDALVFGGRLVQFPDYEGWIVTTVGFSPEARAYMTDEGIHGAILREVKTDDKIVQKIDFTINAFHPLDISVAWHIPEDAAPPEGFEPRSAQPENISIFDEKATTSKQPRTLSGVQ